MIKHFPWLFVLIILTSCAPARPPIPPGVIPQARFVTPAEEEYGHQVLNALSEQYPLDYNHPRFDALVDVVDRLTEAAGANKDVWHVYLFDAPQVKNAAATRGNHVFVWSGMLNQTQNDAELATVLSHEIAHVLAGHTDPDPNEEVKRLLIEVGAMAAGIAVARTTGNPSMARGAGDITSVLTKTVGEGFLINPYSQDKELEADQIGLFIMAKAKYNPQEAITFWSRAQRDPDFSSNASFLSTHPAPEDRLGRLQSLLPQAMMQFNGSAENSSAPIDNGGNQNRSGDSFDWGASTRDNAPPSYDRPPAKTPSKTPPNAKNAYRVISNRAVLFSKPSTRSQPIGEFSRGAIVEVVGKENGYYEIGRPDHGYIHPRDLAPR